LEFAANSPEDCDLIQMASTFDPIHPFEIWFRR